MILNLNWLATILSNNFQVSCILCQGVDSYQLDFIVETMEREAADVEYCCLNLFACYMQAMEPIWRNTQLELT